MDICDLTFKPSKHSRISIINYSDIFRLFKAAALHPACFFCCKSCSSKRFSTLWSSKRACWHSSAQLGPQASWQHENGLRKSWSLLDWQKLKCWKGQVLLEYYEHFMNILEYNRIQKQNSIPSGQSSIRFITRLASAMASLPPDWIAPGAQAFLKCSWHPNLQRKVSRIPAV